MTGCAPPPPGWKTSTRRGERCCARIWTPRRAAASCSKGSRCPGQGLDPTEPVMYLSWTGDGPVMDLPYTCAGDAPDHEAAMPACGRCEPGARSADVDLAMESGAFHSVAPRYRPDQDRGAGSGHLNCHGTRQLDQCARRLRSPLLCSILLSELVSRDAGTCRELPFCAVARIRGGRRIPRAPGPYRTSERTWSEHRCGQV